MGKSVHLFATIALALLASIVTLVVLTISPAKGAANLPQGFTDSQVGNGFTNPTDMAFAPDGRLFIAEQSGKVRIARSGGTLTRFLDISAKVDSNGARGLLALTFDPNFPTNHYVYLHYTKEATATTPVHNRVVRVRASGGMAVASSEKLIFRLDDQDDTHHIGGALDFGNNGKLYIATGDNVGGPTQTLDNLLGKILRINKDAPSPLTTPSTRRLRATTGLSGL
jgi:glucose/arabinose dehydrogenase